MILAIIPGNIGSEFTIISFPEAKEYYNKYIAKNDKGDKFLLYLKPLHELQKGDKIVTSGEFVMPDLARNAGSFNYRRYLNSQKIYGSIFAKNYYLKEVNQFNLIYYIQKKMNDTFAKLFPQNEMGLVMGMMIGETSNISEDILESFKETGITHLIAVSGANVMYVLLCIRWIFEKLLGKRKSIYVAIFFLIMFMFISGASSSVIRATIMAILMLIAELLYKKSDTITNVATSGFVICLINPLVVYDVGFILSFCGTFGIIIFSKDFQLFFKKIFSMDNILIETLAVTCSAQIVLLPVMCFYFNTISTLSILVNLLVVPMSGFITILGFCVFAISQIFFPLAILISKPLYMLAHITISISQIFSKIPFTNFHVITPNVFEILLFYFLLFYGFHKIKNLFPKTTLKKQITIVLVIFFSFEIIFYNIPKNFIEVNLIDVGQGDAIFIKTNTNKVVLVDGGGSETYDVGENTVLPYLLDKRVTHISAIFSSHSDTDHLNGIMTVLNNMSVDTVYIAQNACGYEKLFALAKDKNIEVKELVVGDKVIIDDLKFVTIGPVANIDNKDVNAYSLIIKMEYGSKSMLFTGDINKEAEEKLINVQADVLKVAHHGSDSSTSFKFISKVRPQVSVISVGKNNKYGHPNKDVLKRLSKYSQIYATAEIGEIRLKIFKNCIKILNK